MDEFDRGIKIGNKLLWIEFMGNFTYKFNSWKFIPIFTSLLNILLRWDFIILFFTINCCLTFNSLIPNSILFNVFTYLSNILIFMTLSIFSCWFFIVQQCVICVSQSLIFTSYICQFLSNFQNPPVIIIDISQGNILLPGLTA